MIQVENLVKEFDGLRALDGLCLNVPDGCVYGLVGPNGAGKTTVIRHLTGVYRQDSGCVRIDGLSMKILPSSSVSPAFPTSCTPAGAKPSAI